MASMTKAEQAEEREWAITHLNGEVARLNAIIKSATGLETGKAKWDIDYANSEILSVIDHALFDGFKFDGTTFS
jgi:hypothetical protein